MIAAPLRLRYSTASPYARKTLLVAHEKGVEARITVIPTDVWSPDTDLADDNPMGKVPALGLDDGSWLYDSPVICDYLDHLAPEGPTLVPAAGPERWMVLRWHALGDGIMDAAVARRIEATVRAEDKRDPAWDARQKAVINRILHTLEADSTALTDAPLSLGHLAIGAALGYLDFRFTDDRWRDACPGLSAWYEDFVKRPSMQATMPQ